MRGLGGYFCPSASPSILALVSDNQAVGISLYQPNNLISGRINSPESLYTGLSFCLNTKGRVGNVSPSRGIYGSLLTFLAEEGLKSLHATHNLLHFRCQDTSLNLLLQILSRFQLLHSLDSFDEVLRPASHRQ